MAQYLIIAGPLGFRRPSGVMVPAGAAVNRIVWDGAAPFTPQQDATLIPDDGRPLWSAVNQGGTNG